jgi:hypothetical protein
MKILLIYSWKQLFYSNWGQFNIVLFFPNTDCIEYLAGHHQIVVVFFSGLLTLHGLKKASTGVTSCSFDCVFAP